MTRNLAIAHSLPARTERKVMARTRGSGHGPIVRLMSPSDLGQHLKPFVFLDRIDADAYETPPGHEVGWLAVSHGSVFGEGTFNAGDMIVFDKSDAAIPLQGGADGAIFVLGSAVPHPHDLVLGYYSVHTSEKALKAGDARIAEVRHLYA
jgi:hypothetical protein